MGIPMHPAREEMPEDSPLEGTQVVNVEKLMMYVTEQKAIASEHYKNKNYSVAIDYYNLCIDAMDKTDGLPMHVDDIPLVIESRSTVNSNLANAQYQLQLYQRAIDSATEAIARNPTNSKGLYWRAKAYEAVKQYLLAIEDVRKFAEFDSMTDGECDAWINRLTEKQAAVDTTFDDRVEDANHRGFERKREAFEEIVNKYKLYSEDIADEIGSYCMRETSTAKGLADIYQMEEDDAVIFMDWIRTSVAMKQALNM